MPRRLGNSNAPATLTSSASSSSLSGSRGPRPAKAANCVTPASPSPDSSSDNASDNSDLFSWSAIEPPSPAYPRVSLSSTQQQQPSFASLSTSRKRKALEQNTGLGATVSLAEMRSMGLVGPSRPSVASNPPVTATSASYAGVSSRVLGGGTLSSSSFASSFSFYQGHSFGTTSCSAGGSTESLCSSTADSACGHPPDLPDDGALSTPNPSHGVNAVDNQNADVMEISCVRGTGRESASPGTGMNLSSSTRVAGWKLEDIDDHLAADFDGSLSGLGVDLSVASYNMSEALLALPTLTGFKQEAPSPPNDGRAGNPSPPQQLSSERAVSEGRTVGLSDHIHHSGDHYSHGFSHGILPHSGWSTQELTGGSGPITGGVGTGSASSLASSSSNEGMSGSSSVQQPVSDVFNSSEKYVKYNRLNEADANADNRFQYVLAAATSIATKLNEESLTYLNQGQPYEIKMKKLGDLSNFRGKVLRSVVRLCFHERRLQYMEREQIEAWRLSRPGDRIVEIDVPLSYGIYDVIQDPANLNIVEFVWDPTKEVGVYIKVNCISTEFTPKKHGGEKGVPFRIQVETYSHGDLDGTAKRLHVAGCQIKVFKLKGADRKHKQDREKIFKRPVSEQEKYQPSCECTILAEIPLDLVHTTAIVPVGSVAAAAAAASSSVAAAAVVAGSAATTTAATTTAARNYNSPAQLRKSQSFTSEGCPSESPLGHETDNVESPTSVSGSSSYQYYMQPLSAEASAQQTFQWLQANRFSAVARNFAHFSGADILRLTKNDLIQICGVADGIRLFNALHAKTIVPRLTLYLTQDQTNIFHAVYMENLGCMELVQKISSVLQLQLHQVADVYMEGPGGIHVLVTDEVIHNTKDESMFAVEILRDQNGERYRLLLKPTAPR